jgi:hypothetical protein
MLCDAHVAQAAKPALLAARRVVVFFKQGEASPRQQAWQFALRASRVTSAGNTKQHGHLAREFA